MPVVNVVGVGAATVAGATARLARALAPPATAAVAAITSAAAAPPAGTRAIGVACARAAASAPATAAIAVSSTAALEKGDEVVDIDRAWHRHDLGAAGRPLRRVVTAQQRGGRRDTKKCPGVGALAAEPPVPGGLASPLGAGRALGRARRRG